MSDAFVWFHNNGDKPGESIDFYEKLLGWKASEGPGGMKMLGGDKGRSRPWASGTGMLPGGSRSRSWRTSMPPPPTPSSWEGQSSSRRRGGRPASSRSSAIRVAQRSPCGSRPDGRVGGGRSNGTAKFPRPGVRRPSIGLKLANRAPPP